MKEKKCEKCDAIMINIGAIHICPNCYDVEVEDEKWEGHKHTCPKCGKDIKLFQTHHKGKVFHCKHCNTVGHVINQKEYHKKTYNISKASQLGKKLYSCLFMHNFYEIACEINLYIFSFCKFIQCFTVLVADFFHVAFRADCFVNIIFSEPEFARHIKQPC